MTAGKRTVCGLFVKTVVVQSDREEWAREVLLYQPGILHKRKWFIHIGLHIFKAFLLFSNKMVLFSI